MNVLVMLLVSCGQLSKPTALIGDWKTNTFNVTVRSKPEGKWQFISDTCSISLTIKNDFTVNGTIGSAKFKNGTLRTNWLLPVKMTGQSYTIKCGSIGKIFKDDPLDAKKVELWLGPLENDTINVDFRYTESGAQFPMARTQLMKEK